MGGGPDNGGRRDLRRSERNATSHPALPLPPSASHATPCSRVFVLPDFAYLPCHHQEKASVLLTRHSPARAHQGRHVCVCTSRANSELGSRQQRRERW